MARQSSYRRSGLHRRLHRLRTRLGSHHLAGFINQHRALAAYPYRTQRRMPGKRVRIGLNLRPIQHLHMIELVSVHHYRGSMRRAAGGKILMPHRRYANRAIHVRDIDNIDVHISGLHVNAPAFAHV